jgi:hypothetical protein
MPITSPILVSYSIVKCGAKNFSGHLSINIVAGQSGGRIGSENCFPVATFANSLIKLF